MRYLIVNADDFGYSFGINKGILEAHTRGIVTSTSVMVDMVASAEAADLNRFKELSVGLHFVLSNQGDIAAELSRQVEKFTQIVGRKPDHIDTHKSQPSTIQVVRDLLSKYSLESATPVRSLGAAKLIKSFFGLNIDGSGKLDESRISLDGLKAAIDLATDEYNELMCHPGYSDEYLRGASSYNDIREQELAALSNPSIKDYIKAKGDLALCSWNDLRSTKS